jgi:GNAT superfamily N-acetyltransferase
LPTVSIRRATAADAGLLFTLIRALAEYERLEPPDDAALERLRADGFGRAPRFETWLAEVDGEAVGYAITFETYSTFLARPTLYLEDLFVRPEARRQGAGTALLRRLAAEAVARGCGRMEWTVLDWNEMARRVYRRIGADLLEEWRFCRLSGEALARAAKPPADAHRD